MAHKIFSVIQQCTVLWPKHVPVMDQHPVYSLEGAVSTDNQIAVSPTQKPMIKSEVHHESFQAQNPGLVSMVWTEV